MKKIIVKTNKSLRLDSYLINEYPMLTLSNVNKFARQNKIKLNSKKAKPNDRISNGDEISLYLNDEYFLKPNATNAFLFARDNFDIVFEDENFVVVNKPSGIPVIDDNYSNFDTLINRAKKHYNNSNFTPSLCHRLDTGTSGLVFIAKNNDFLEFMKEEFKNKSLEKNYICVCYGDFNLNKSIQKAFLYKDSKTSTSLISNSNKSKGYKEIETHIHLTESIDNFHLLHIKLVTGRTHQIRAHLKFLNLPILGDSKYGILDLNRKNKLKYQLLHSSKVKFSNISNEKFKYLEFKEFQADSPWFLSAFYEKEFSI